MNLRMSLLSGAMALTLVVPAAAQTTELAAGMTATATAGVNLRAGPGSKHDRLTVIPEGAAVVIEDCVSGWCEVAYDGINGFVYDDYLAAEVAADEWILQTTAAHSLRAGPGTEHSAVAEIPAGAAVAVEECMPGWCEVTYDGMSGFIEIVAATPEETRAALPTTAAVAIALPASGLVVRAGPGTGHNRVTAIPQGASVEIGQCAENWCEVAYGDATGYAWESYLEPQGGPATASAVSPSAAQAIALPASGLVVRAGPGTDHHRIAAIPQGASVEIGQCIEKWCEVAYGDASGYAWASYLEPQVTPASASALAPLAAGENVARATGDLNLRAGAGMRHDPIAVIPAGATVDVHDCMPDRVWCEVSYGDMTGYASDRYLDFDS